MSETDDFMSGIARVEMFLAAIRTRAAMQVGQGLEPRIVYWLANYRGLHRTLERYRATYTTYMHYGQRYRPQRQGRWYSASRRATAARHELAQLHELYRALQCEGESFYTLALTVLDNIADTFQCYFGLERDRSEATHTRLTRDFYALCTTRALVLAPPALLTLMPDVYARIVESRARLTSMSDARCLMACLTTLDAYSAALIDFLTLNRDKSIVAELWLSGEAPAALTNAPFPPYDDAPLLATPRHSVLP